MKLRKYNKVGLVGLAMGVAETIPGVSGGTIAFIFKIYEELLSTIKSFNPSNIRLFFKGEFSSFFEAVNGRFLLFLLAGMGAGIVIGVFLIDYLLINHPLLIWSFFFGLVLASAIYLSFDVKWNWLRILTFVIGATLSYYITLISPAQGSDNLFIIMLSGMIAISALMLPGLSGSFILLLLGMYSTVIGAVKGFLSAPSIGQNFYVIIAFACGCFVGLFSFARVLSYTFKNYFHTTMALMIGILIGSLNKLWPWRIPDQMLNKETNEIINWSSSLNYEKDDFKIITELNLWPNEYSELGSPQLLPCLVALIIAMMFIFILTKKSSTKES